VPIDVAAARRRFDAEQARFRSAVVAAVDDGQRKTDVAADAKISRPALDAWIKAARSSGEHSRPTRPADEGYEDCSSAPTIRL
jgi:transposase-like protein